MRFSYEFTSQLNAVLKLLLARSDLLTYLQPRLKQLLMQNRLPTI